MVTEEARSVAEKWKTKSPVTYVQNRYMNAHNANIPRYIKEI